MRRRAQRNERDETRTKNGPVVSWIGWLGCYAKPRVPQERDQGCIDTQEEGVGVLPSIADVVYCLGVSSVERQEMLSVQGTVVLLFNREQ